MADKVYVMRWDQLEEACREYLAAKGIPNAKNNKLKIHVDSERLGLRAELSEYKQGITATMGEE